MVQSHRIVDILFAWCQLTKIKLFFFRYPLTQCIPIEELSTIKNYIYNLINDIKCKNRNNGNNDSTAHISDDGILSNFNDYEDDEEEIDNLNTNNSKKKYIHNKEDIENLPNINLLKIMYTMKDKSINNTIHDETKSIVCYISDNHDAIFFLVRNGYVSLNPIFCDYIKKMDAYSNGADIIISNHKYDNDAGVVNNTSIEGENLKFVNRNTFNDLIIKISNLLTHPINLNVLDNTKGRARFSIS